jgi:kinesin family member 15
VDLASLENDELDGAANHCAKEERHLKKSLSKLGYVNLYNGFIQT